MQWEDALGAFASTTQTSVTRRDQVAADGGASWFASHTADTTTTVSQSFSWDAWWSYAFSVTMENETTNYTTVVGVDLDWGQFGDDSPLGQFNAQPEKILTPLVWSPNQNDTTSVWSFEAAATMMQDLDVWLTGWMPVINGWADAINAPDDDFQGSAAGAFRYLLRGFATELGTLHIELNTPGPYWTSLNTARTQLGATHVALWNGYSTWRANRRSMPVNCVHDAFLDAMGSASVTVDSSALINDESATPTVTIATNLGDPQSQDFWDRVQHNAKQYWLLEVSAALDAAAVPAITTLDGVYQTATQALADIGQTQLQAPPVPDPTNNDSGDPTGDGKGDSPDIGDGQGGDGTSAGAGDPSATAKGEGPAAVNAPSVTSGSPSNGLGKPGGPVGTPKQLAPSVTPGAPSNGTDVPVLKDGKQVTDPKTGQPIMVPPGTTVGKNGELFGPDGRPILGADGKPVYAPPGSKPGGPEDPANLVTTGHVVNATVPKGSTIGSDGVIRGPDGKTVLDANGNPVHVSRGTTIGKDGTVLGPNGKPVPEQTQLLDNEEHAMLHPDLLPRPKTTSAVSGGLPGLPAISAGGASPGVTTTGLSARAVENGGRLTPEQLAAREATAGESAAEQAQLMGRQTATSGGEPMMPPMGGMGGAGAGGGQDRQRTTWLAEDEEVWGTDSDVVSGVIGR
ncbi:MAG: hypothetical protein ACRDP6_08015 [Actinoallomurus sp.]